METISDRKRIFSWAFYDWANSAFATTVMAGFFPLFFKQYWSAGTAATVSTFQLGAANSTASIIVAFLAPILGAIADQGSVRKKFLLYFAAMGIVMTGALPFVARGNWEAAIALYIFATIGFSGGNIFYDALIVNVAPKEQMDSVSALGFALGYLGGGLLFALNITMTLTPRTFGLNDASEAVRLSFISVAVWWAIFSIPLLVFVPEPKNNTPGPRRNPVSAGFQQLKTTFKKVRRLRVVCLFLLGYWLYIDGLDTIVRMAVDYGMSLGFASKDLITALLITQFVGFPAAMAFGWIGEKLGAKTGIFMGITVYLGVTLWGFFMQEAWEFYLIAAVIGLVQGGVQSLSRSFYTRIIPKNQSAEFFGFYNLLGKFAAVIGPLLMGWVGVLTGNARYSILSISILFLCGGALLAFVNEDEGRRLAEQLERRSFDSCTGHP
ncbi:MFS transporter [Desulforhabdus sp. TSK]|uniref:MFS transporter n=1 Tax=Desulforhabdus sp. TSK TaxID=2925014 RepID=UPI001FC8B08C|nr:MFS transporter [Desulforhabdus sp. TSK]GKT10576.1 MFS transporter [Desulforhabdus sp. TSK]